MAALTLKDVGDILAAASPFMPEDGRIWVTFDGENGIVLQTTHPQVARAVAHALDAASQHPTREHVKQWARDVTVNGRDARLQVEFIDPRPRVGFDIWHLKEEGSAA